MQKHCRFVHFFEFLNQIGPKGTLIVTHQLPGKHRRPEFETRKVDHNVEVFLMSQTGLFPKDPK